MTGDSPSGAFALISRVASLPFFDRHIFVHKNEVGLPLFLPFRDGFPAVHRFGEDKPCLAENLFEKETVCWLIFGNENADLTAGNRIR